MKLDEQQNVLVAHLGVYGCWLLKHGKNLPESEARDNLIDAYDMYHRRADSCAAAILMNRIDEFCEAHDFEKPRGHYETALKEVLAIRQRMNAFTRCKPSSPATSSTACTEPETPGWSARSRPPATITSS